MPLDLACEATTEMLDCWVASIEEHCSPRNVYWCDGSPAEKEYLSDLAVRRGIFHRLNPDRWPGCYHHRAHPLDAVENNGTPYVCSVRPEDSSSTHLWMDPNEMSEQMYRNLRGALRGRTMYVVPFVMGPPGSKAARVGVQLTDSLYLVLCLLNLEIVGAPALEALESSPYFFRAIQFRLDLDPDRRLVALFPEDKLVLAIGSSFSANPLLAKQSITLGLASRLAKDEGWLVGHLSLFGLESPAGEKHYFAAVLPRGCRRSGLSMLTPPPAFPGWRLTTLSNCAAWLRPGSDGRLYAISPRAGYYGPLPGVDLTAEPNLAETLGHDCIFTNCAITQEGDPLWDATGGSASLSDSFANVRPQNTDAHVNSRFCVSATNNPVLDSAHLATDGVPISAILFCGLYESPTSPLLEAYDWKHGISIGATLRSGNGHGSRSIIDPFAMRAFVGYPLESYIRSWGDLGFQLSNPPKIFQVDWFWRLRDLELQCTRSGETGSASPRYPATEIAANFWILHWIFRRCSGSVDIRESPLGLIPDPASIEPSGLTSSDLTALKHLLQQAVDEEGD